MLSRMPFQAGKLYIADYVDLLSGIKRNEGLVCADSCGLFYVKGDDFLPIAIQLVPNDRDYLFTPKDTSDDWLLAKMYFRGSMSSIHQVSVVTIHVCIVVHRSFIIFKLV